MTKEDIKEIGVENYKILKNSKQSIKIKTIEEKIVALKQYKLKILLNVFLFRPHDLYYVYKTDELEETEHTKKLTN